MSPLLALNVPFACARLEGYFTPGASYKGRRDGGEWVAFTAGAANNTFQLPGILGKLDV
jgi:hypothetical protein